MPLYVTVPTHKVYQIGDIVRYEGTLFQQYQYVNVNGRSRPVGPPKMIYLNSGLCRVEEFRKYVEIKWDKTHVRRFTKIVIRQCGGRRFQMEALASQLTLVGRNGKS